MPQYEQRKAAYRKRIELIPGLQVDFKSIISVMKTLYGRDAVVELLIVDEI